MIVRDVADLDRLVFDAEGLLPVITQDIRTGQVLMMAWANRDALERTLDERRMTYWSRSRRELWRKGDTSGNHQSLVALHADCDADALLALVEAAGPACHTGADSCFETGPVLLQLGDVIRDRMTGTEGPGHTRRLLADENLRLKKLGEEAVEVALACRSGDRESIAAEAADLLYHLLVACAAADVDETSLLGELARRRATG